MRTAAAILAAWTLAGAAVAQDARPEAKADSQSRHEAATVSAWRYGPGPACIDSKDDVPLTFPYEPQKLTLCVGWLAGRESVIIRLKKGGQFINGEQVAFGFDGFTVLYEAYVPIEPAFPR